MKIRGEARDKYAWYLSLCRDDEPRPVDKIPMDPKGLSGMEAFHVRESQGLELPTREPELLEKFLQGKKWHGVTVQMVAESYVDRTMFSKEIKENYPDWVSDEIFSASIKIAQKKMGYVPRFILERKDFSEDA